jgi:hypothetical protein
MTPDPHTALVLWLIRERVATTWSALVRYFFENYYEPNVPSLYRALDTLRSNHLIRIVDGEDGLGRFGQILLDHDPGEVPVADVAFSATPPAFQVLDALGVSLSDLAKSEPHDRMIVSPELNRTRGTQYQSDILVFMPFADALRPVYEDHLRSVAERLGKSIKRADDFFTNREIVREIWTALLQTTAVIADCTDRNPNVFYELGLAHAIGKPTILITQNHDDIPFDLRHRRYINYELTPRGMKRFEEELEQTMQSVFWEEVADIPDSARF